LIITKANSFGITETYLKASGKMIHWMVFVRKKWLFYDLFILTLFGDSIDNMFWNDEDRYECEFQDNSFFKKEMKDSSTLHESSIQMNYLKRCPYLIDLNSYFFFY